MQKYANLVELEKCCQMHIFLQNFVLMQPRTSPPKICKKLQNLPNAACFWGLAGRGDRVRVEPRPVQDANLPPNLDFANVPPLESSHGVFTKKREQEFAFFANSWKFLVGSFSAVSKRHFARKYAFDNIFQALQDLHASAPLQSQNFSEKSVWKFAKFCNFGKI